MGIGASAEAIIDLVHRLHVATAEQVCRRLYSPGSLTYVRDRLARLTRDEYLHRSHMGKASRSGSSPFVYTLDRHGRDYLLHLGHRVDRLRKSEIDRASRGHLAHSLLVGDFLIAAELLCQRQPDFRLRRVFTRELAEEPARVRLGTGTTGVVIPDAWLELRRPRGDGTAAQYCLALEADRGQEHANVWQAKVEKLAAWAYGPYEEQFGTRALTVLVVTTSAARRDDLRAWTAVALQRAQAGSLFNHFLFTAASAAGTDPAGFFLSPLWSTIGADVAVPVIQV